MIQHGQEPADSRGHLLSPTTSFLYTYLECAMSRTEYATRKTLDPPTANPRRLCCSPNCNEGRNSMAPAATPRFRVVDPRWNERGLYDWARISWSRSEKDKDEVNAAKSEVK